MPLSTEQKEVDPDRAGVSDKNKIKRDPQPGGRTVLLALAAFAILSTIASLTSQGFLDADAATHYLFARYALHDPFYLFNVWGRPLTTGLYAPAAALAGRTGVHVVSLACALGCALLAWRLAILQNYRRPQLAAIFTLGQPLLFFHSYSEMTELPFAFVSGLAFLGYRLEKWWLLAIAGAMLPLGRPEGFGFCLLAAGALAMHRRWRWLLVMPVPTAAWSLAGWWVESAQAPWWRWLQHSWPYAAQSDYPAGPLLHYLLILPMLVSPAAFPAIALGIWRSLRIPLKPTDGHPSVFSLQRPSQFLIAALPVSVLIVHSLLHWLGRFSSNGELRYLLIVAPFWALLAADGWDWLFDRLAWSNPVGWAALSLIAVAQINWIVRVVPEPLPDNWQSARRLVAWYKSSALRHDYPHLLFAHPAVEYFLDVPPSDPVRAVPWSRNVIAADPAGVLLIWDSDLSARNADPNRDVTVPDLRAAGWQERPVPSGVGREWRIFLSRPPARQ